MYEREGGHCAGAYTLADAVEAERSFPNSTVDARRIVARCTLLGARKGSFLDVGCGAGFFSAEAAAAGFEVDPVEVADAERAVAAEMLGVWPEKTAFEDVERPPRSASVVLMSQTLEHAYDPVAWVEKANRLLQPGGILAVAVPSFDSLFRRLLQERDPYVTPPVHLNYFTHESLRTLFRSQGLVPCAVETVSRVTPTAFQRFGPAAIPARALAEPALRLAAWCGLGIFLNGYARSEG